MKATRIIAAAALMAGIGLALQTAHAQPSGIGRTEVVRSDISVPGREAIQVRVDFAPGAAFGMHTHPGEEIAYVLEGTLEYQFDGKPPITLKAGDSLFIPAGTPHSARNVSGVKASELATYIVDKNKPVLVLK